MIAYLTGDVLELATSHVIINCSGIGYQAGISLSTYSELQDKKSVSIFTKQIIRDDAHLLFGFAKKKEKELFELLIGVNSVGPSSAMTILSTLDLELIQSAIQNNDAKTIESVKGIGSKTAQKIILDLKDKISKEYSLETPTHQSKNKIKIDALKALEVLGLNKLGAEKILDKLLYKNDYLSVEDLVRDALKKQS